MSTPEHAARPCWQWRSNTTAWFRRVGAAGREWSPPAALRAAPDDLRGALLDAAGSGEGWLLHPVLTALTDPRFQAAQAAQVRLTAWAIAHLADRLPDDLRLEVNEPVWAWGSDGTLLLEPGSYSPEGLAAIVGAMPDALVPDPWGDSFSHRDDLGDLVDHAWWNKSDAEVTDRLAADLRALMAAEHALEETLPATSRWMRDAARVVVPLASPPSPAFRSGTMADLPGLVLVEVTNQYLLTLEALVHETAHLHFHLEEMSAPFFVPGDPHLYSSPLRVDPRPLRGIFLAYHALAHMVSFYEDWAAATGDPRCAEALPELIAGRDDAAATLQAAEDTGLTDAGRGFLHTCLALMSDRAHA
jgi:hypothetical protein